MNVRLKEHQKQIYYSSKAIFELMKEILLRRNKIDRGRENFWVVYLNGYEKVIGVELVSMGTYNETLVNAKEVFCGPLIKRACKIVLVHNHPGGRLFPSVSDIDVTDQLIQVGRLVDIFVVDHVIISEDGFYSFKDGGLISLLEEFSFYTKV